MEELPLPAGVSPSTFPAKLWQLVNSPRVRSVRWDARAQGLLVDRALFERELLSAGGAGGDAAAPGAFKATNFGSFVRQLNLYGFHKTPVLAGGGAAGLPGSAGALLRFCSPYFRRDRPELLVHIKRLTRANRERMAAGLEVRSRQPSRFQQLHRDRLLPPGAVTLSQNLFTLPARGLNLSPVPTTSSQGAQGCEASAAPPSKVVVTPGLLRFSGEVPITSKSTVQPVLFLPLLHQRPQSAAMALPEHSSCTASEQNSPAYNPAASLGSSAPHSLTGSAGSAASTTSSWACNPSAADEWAGVDLEVVFQMLEEVLASNLPEMFPFLEGNISVPSESSGGEPVTKAAEEKALPGNMSSGNSPLEPKEPEVHELYLARRAALRGRKRPRESL
ncbi:heat shock factor protein 5 [Myiozetetes cayanensis]|uniref:heat shock factor protein 5 n=1 Tax=Myiozetetes cayanensis TaxID=478635 RepID=UPI00215F4D18|nr:heat shock factor protein 5 [Myiozetetes cayanensis]